jgi:hypothetical protein
MLQELTGVDYFDDEMGYRLAMLGAAPDDISSIVVDRCNNEYNRYTKWISGYQPDRSRAAALYYRKRANILWKF